MYLRFYTEMKPFLFKFVFEIAGWLTPYSPRLKSFARNSSTQFSPFPLDRQLLTWSSDFPDDAFVSYQSEKNVSVLMVILAADYHQVGLSLRDTDRGIDLGGRM